MPQNKSNIDFHSSEIQDIIGRPPRWVIRWGLILMGIIIALFAIAAWVIKYPETIVAPVSVSLSTPPRRVMAKADGYILKLQVKDQEKVDSGQIIAVLESKAKADDVFILNNAVSDIVNTGNIGSSLRQLLLKDSLQLGAMQDDYLALVQALNEYEGALKKDGAKKASITRYGTGGELRIRNISKAIKAEIVNWENLNLIRSPIKGEIRFLKIWGEQQYISMGETIFVVLPSNKQYISRAEIPLSISNKVKRGQDVLIKVSEFPHQEFGMLYAKVGDSVPLYLDSVCLVQLLVDPKLKTTRNIQIPGRSQMKGVAEIITGRRSIIRRIFESMLGDIDKQ